MTAVEGLFELLNARIVEDLVGACLRIIVFDNSVGEPEVKEVLTTLHAPIPDAFRLAFGDDP